MVGALKKRVSKKEFLKICAAFMATTLISLPSINVLKNPNVEKSGKSVYGVGSYGG
jgi:hypothetical protein